MVRIAVAGEKALQADDAARIRRPDQHRTAGAALDQADAAQDQRAHDALAEIGLGDQQRAQALRRNQQRFDLALGMAVDQRDPAGELADLGEKLARSLVDDRRHMAEAVALGDRDVAGQHHEHARPRPAGLEQFFAVAVVADIAEPAHAGDFLRRQRAGRSAHDAGMRRRPKPAPPSCLLPCCLRPFRPASIGESQSRRGKTRRSLTARLFSAVVIWRDIAGMGRCRCRIVSPPRLGFSPLQVFAQRPFQPILPGFLARIAGRAFRRGPVLPLAFVLLIRHRRPVRWPRRGRGTIGA